MQYWDNDAILRNLTRRKFLAGASALTVAATFPWACSSVTDTVSGLAFAPTGPRAASSGFNADVDLSLVAEQAYVSLLPGGDTPVFRYRATGLAGPASSVTAIPGSYLGPILKFHKGQNVRIRLTNNLLEKTIVHWHGLRVPEHSDGHPRLAILPGQTYVYEFPLIEDAGTYWFHPHTHGVTGRQVIAGMAGLIIVTDDAESTLGLPSGDYDLPLVIQDRSFNSDNTFQYDVGSMGQGMGNGNGGGGMGMVGFHGDRILVNGSLNASYTVRPSQYRLRLLNGSNARIYKLALDNGTPLTVIGSDCGLLPSPVTRSYVTVSPGERVELFVDFRAMSGTVSLVSLAYDASDVGSGTGMGGVLTTLPIGAGFMVATFIIAGAAVTSGVLPATLNAATFPANGVADHTVELYMQQGSWTLSGRTFVMEEVATDELVTLGDTQAWLFDNRSGQPMPHPMHLHAVRYKVVERIHDGSYAGSYNALSGGFVDEGWKDTVLVMPGEQVKVVMQYDGYPGLFLYHCHNLEHHDGGMMRNFYIQS
jgi:FtsP/CotA-like multicopper oxidase with cupredoxin domain